MGRQEEEGGAQRLEALGGGASEPPDQGEGELGIQELKRGVKSWSGERV